MSVALNPAGLLSTTYLKSIVLDTLGVTEVSERLGKIQQTRIQVIEFFSMSFFFFPLKPEKIAFTSTRDSWSAPPKPFSPFSLLAES